MDLEHAFRLANELMKEHGLTEWTFKLNRNRRSLGICKEGPRRIELSSLYVMQNSSAHVRDTILHEIAHALVGVHHGHDSVWKQMCLRLGCTAKACDSTAVLPEGAWQARCAGCLTLFSRHRRPKLLVGLYCRKCGPQRGKLFFKNLRKASFKPVKPVRKGLPKEPRQLTLPFGELLP
ncbi:MAG TPA: SprT-like domain-containing protein [Candidatus Obscuribacterales bacterium]